MNDGSDSDSHPDDDGNYDGSSDEENDRIAANVDAEIVAAAERLIKSQPLKKVLRKVKTKVRTEEEVNTLTTEIEDYLTTLFNLPYCFARYQHRFVSCCCVQLVQRGCSFAFLAARLGEF